MRIEIELPEEALPELKERCESMIMINRGIEGNERSGTAAQQEARKRARMYEALLAGVLRAEGVR